MASKERIDTLTGLIPLGDGTCIMEFDGEPRKSVCGRLLAIESGRVFFVRPTRLGQLLGVGIVGESMRADLSSVARTVTSGISEPESR